MVDELESTWRVYRKEWLHWRRFRDEQQARDGVTEEFGGRLLDEDIRLVNDKYRVISGTVAVEVRRWNMAGQWKHREAADRHADYLGGVVVARNSRAEHEMLQYGKLKLRKTS